MNSFRLVGEDNALSRHKHEFKSRKEYFLNIKYFIEGIMLQKGFLIFKMRTLKFLR